MKAEHKDKIRGRFSNILYPFQTHFAVNLYINFAKISLKIQMQKMENCLLQGKEDAQLTVQCKEYIKRKFTSYLKTLIEY